MVERVTSQDNEGVERFLRWRTRAKQHRADAGEASPQQVYADWMKKTVGPALRAEEMRGSGGRFELPSDVVWAQLGFQKSAYSDAHEVRFTVNLSVIARATWAEQAATKPHLGERPSPTIHYGTWADQVRIGLLTPSGEDTWWRIIRGAQSSDALDDALQVVTTYAVPWLRERLL